MALSDIIKKIEQDTKREVKNILRSAEQEVQEIEVQTQKQKQEKEVFYEGLLQEKETEIEKTQLALARQKAKNFLDSEKRKILDGIFAEALDKIHTLENAEKAKYVLQLLGRIDEDLSQAVFLVSSDKKLLLEEIQKQERYAQIPEETIEGTEVLVLQIGQTEYAVDYPVFLEESKQNKEIEIAQKIFA